MTWLAIVILAVWCVFQHKRSSVLGERMAELQMKIAALAAHARSEATPEIQAAAPIPPLEPAAAPPLIQAAPPPELQASPSPEFAPASGPAAADDLVAATPSRAPVTVQDWLSENGLAWIGGGALALGGLLLVAYAAQHGFFTPAMRIAAAVVLGLGALGVGEALRRDRGGERSRHLLVASLTTAAGASILYGAVWAAYVLYGFIPAGAAVALMAGISLDLLALALLHGEPLGVLAVAAAYAVPVACGGAAWSAEALDLFVLLIVVTGIATSVRRRWTWACALTLVGVALWALDRAVARDRAGETSLALSAPLMMVGLMALSRRIGNPRAAEAGGPFRILLTVSFIGSCVLGLMFWSPAASGIPYAAVATAVLLLAVAAAARIRLAWASLLAAPVAAGLLGVLLSCATPGAVAEVPWVLGVLLAMAGAGFIASWSSDDTRVGAALGAGGAALALALGGGALAKFSPRWDWAIDAAFVALLTGGAAMLGRRAKDGSADWTTGAWVVSAAATAVLALHAGLEPRPAAVAYALLAMTLAGSALALNWRGLAQSAALGCFVSFAAVLAGGMMSGAASAPRLVVAAVAGGASLAQFGVWCLLKLRGGHVWSAETASTFALATALAGAFQLLWLWSLPRGGAAALDAFGAACLRTVLVLAAGLMLAAAAPATRFGRARAAFLLGLGAIHGLLLEGFALNPWWGADHAPVAAPVFNMLLLGLLAPAILLWWAAHRIARARRPAAGAAVASALVFLLIWILTELRRLFHGAALAVGPLGYSETAAYATALLAFAASVDAARPRLMTLVGVDEAVEAASRAVAWVALGVALVLLTYVASPWWGPLDGDLRAPLLFAVIYVGACGATAILAARARRAGRDAFASAVVVAAGIEIFCLLTLLVRYLFHGEAMRAPLAEASLETWIFSVSWALYGLGMLASGAIRRDITLRWIGLAVLLGATAKVFLFDMARLEGVIRAASFLALGIALLVAALAARRFGRPTPTLAALPSPDQP